MTIALSHILQKLKQAGGFNLSRGKRPTILAQKVMMGTGSVPKESQHISEYLAGIDGGVEEVWPRTFLSRTAWFFNKSDGQPQFYCFFRHHMNYDKIQLVQ